MDKHELMKLTPLFMGLSEAEQNEIAEQFTAAQSQTDRPLFSTGDQSDAFYLVAQGFVRLTTPDGQTLATMGPGSVLGEASMFRGVPYETTAVAASDIEFLKLTDAQLRSIILKNSSIGVKLSGNFGSMIAQMQDFLVALLSRTSELSDLPPHTLGEMAEKLDPTEVESGQVICRDGEIAQGLLFVESGTIDLRLEDVGGQEQVTAGTILGAAPLLTNKPYTYTATVSDSGRLWRLAAEDFQAISTRNPGLRRSLGRSVRSRLGRADQAQASMRLASMPLFAQLPQPVVDAMAQRMVLQYAPAGERVYRVGEAGDAVYFIENGEIELTAENASGVVEELARIGADGFCGEQSLLSGQIRTEDATATRNTNLWVLYRSDLDALAAQYPAIGKAMSDAISARLAAENTNADLTRFREFALLAGLSDPDLGQIVQYLEPDRYRAGEQVFRTSTPPERLYLIDQGQVRIQPLNGGSWILGSGQTFGEHALLNNQPHNSSAFAETDIDVWTLSKADFDLLLARYPNLAINISRMLSERLEGQAQAAPMAQPMTGDAAYAPPGTVVPVGAPRPQYATDPVAAQPKKQGGFGAWFRNLSGGKKVLFALLILLVFWLLVVAAPMALREVMRVTGLGNGSSLAMSPQEAIRAVYNLGSYDVAAQDATMAQQVAMADNQVQPTATYTPPPTKTALPTPTPTVTNTPIPPTATPTPAPIAFIAAAPVQQILDEQKEAEVQAAAVAPRIWDSRLEQLGVFVEDAQVSPGQEYWRLVDAAWWNEEESRGKHHIYVEVLDANGERIVGHPVTVTWSDGAHTGQTEDKAPPDYGFNYQMYAAGHAYNVKVEGLPSDVLKGAGMGSIADRFRGNHTSFLLVYQKSTK